ncbi:hypothetical protein B0H16DRAFT_782066 [Mycena metata]|uniref:Uncharacterized protein n=1 Tax=Mycena metata TaxID=1033252 RepID=A0AAD7NAT9_9AGAR|nr:hypothetical protein B0H16DRAFT_782066 [Mycena metata]
MSSPLVVPGPSLWRRSNLTHPEATGTSCGVGQFPIRCSISSHVEGGTIPPFAHRIPASEWERERIGTGTTFFVVQFSRDKACRAHLEGGDTVWNVPPWCNTLGIRDMSASSLMRRYAKGPVPKVPSLFLLQTARDTTNAPGVASTHRHSGPGDAGSLLRHATTPVPAPRAPRERQARLPLVGPFIAAGACPRTFHLRRSSFALPLPVD